VRITLIAFGTRGDVTPIVALGTRLCGCGHEVRLASHAEFETMATQQGLSFHPIPGSYYRISDYPGNRFWYSLGVPPGTPLGLSALFSPFLDCAAAVFKECYEVCRDAGAIVSSPLATVIAKLIAQVRDVPMAVASPIPPVPSRYLPCPGFPAWPLGPSYNWLTHALSRRLIRRGASDVFDVWHREARLVDPSASSRPVRDIALIATSPLVIPRPRDWPATAHLTGYWFLPEDTPGVVPDDVRAFMEAGPPPICLGFGSMADADPEGLRAMVLDALARLKIRAVVVGGSGGALSGFGNRDDVLEAPFVDYGWLFRKVSAVVHQGGAGTAAYCLTAGVPQVIVPYFLDHHFWAWRMLEIGVAPRSIPRRKLTVSRLVDAIGQAVENPAFRDKAAGLAPKISAERGLDEAIRILNDHIRSGSRT
jgi:O-mycaminosyltylonolide 6-deoxyallosyltransferase